MAEEQPPLLFADYDATLPYTYYIYYYRSATVDVQMPAGDEINVKLSDTRVNFLRTTHRTTTTTTNCKATVMQQLLEAPPSTLMPQRLLKKYDPSALSEPLRVGIYV
ncbi:unnamed protein product [Ceratitis capitata]|uniref:(Mediterranean fruit fly) hypothetical protein n=1 Tax=Ceratitis capitata TaxID=7213 RepID=A0A811V6A3_CERCA|nr:unnamed protein product [Ceratitis capitata]